MIWNRSYHIRERAETCREMNPYSVDSWHSTYPPFAPFSFHQATISKECSLVGWTGFGFAIHAGFGHSGVHLISEMTRLACLVKRGALISPFCPGRQLTASPGTPSAFCSHRRSQLGPYFPRRGQATLPLEWQSNSIIGRLVPK